MLGYVCTANAAVLWSSHNASNSVSLNSNFSSYSKFSNSLLAKESLTESKVISIAALVDLAVDVIEDGDYVSTSASTSAATTDKTLELIEVFDDNYSLFLSRVNASAFQAYQQQTPIYWLVFEFNPPDSSLLTISDDRFPNHSFTFVYSAYGSNHRLSGWKDGNSLYTSRIIYS